MTLQSDGLQLSVFVYPGAAVNSYLKKSWLRRQVEVFHCPLRIFEHHAYLLLLDDIAGLNPMPTFILRAETAEGHMYGAMFVTEKGLDREIRYLRPEPC